MSLSFNKGDARAFSTAFMALSSPSACADPIIATPDSLMTVRTSSKSTFMYPVRVMISAIPFAAVANTSSAIANACAIGRLPHISRSFSLLMIRSVSTLSRMSCIPCSACCRRFFPSKKNGMVTIPTVSTPISRAVLAITGAAPVPVPPPIPAVMKIILVLLERISFNSSMFSIAAFLPTSAIEPAPRPSVSVEPNCTFNGTGLTSNACWSVLHTRKSTPSIPCWNMWLTALLPPPPTPNTLMMFEFSFGKSNFITIYLWLL